MPTHIARGNATRARIRARVGQLRPAKMLLGLIARTLGMVRTLPKPVGPLV